ncbi:MAG: DUF1330 domain-containing protein [Gammaproteobacteria bacterium]|nr:DUF1330 domain-containing protein [Gammaproteobacteria bacterium]
MIARIIVTDEARYAEYARLAGPSVERYGGHYLVRGGETRTIEGPHRPRNVVSVWPSMERALQWYHSPEYEHARSHREGAAEVELCFVEGFES